MLLKDYIPNINKKLGNIFFSGISFNSSNIKYKGTPYNTAGWTTVETTGQIVEKIGPILATKYSEIN